MKTNLFSLLAATLVAGCATCDKCCSKGVVGNWGLRLPYDSMNAGHAIFTEDADGNAKGLVLWRWASPIDMKSVVIDGKNFKVEHPWGFFVEGSVCGDKLTGEVYKMKDGVKEVVGPVEGWRNAPVEPASTKDAKLGDPIDLLADGLDGWQTMDEKAKFGWSFKDGVLSNKLGLKPDGSWAGGGANLMSRRADFFDFNLEYDVRVPAKSNSGVYLRGRYECQVVDSYGQPVNEHNMAAYYGRVVPKTAAEKKPGEWQHVSVTLYKRHLTVVLNGVTIIEDAPVVGITGGAIDAREDVAGPIYLQGDHSDADFRNMILRPAK